MQIKITVVVGVLFGLVLSTWTMLLLAAAGFGLWSAMIVSAAMLQHRWSQERMRSNTGASSSLPRSRIARVLGWWASILLLGGMGHVLCRENRRAIEITDEELSAEGHEGFSPAIWLLFLIEFVVLGAAVLFVELVTYGVKNLLT